MSTSTASATVPGRESRVLKEGYGPGAWHGPDLKAALADVTQEAAFWRPGKDRHNIAEIALHHAYCTRAVCAQISGAPATPFVLDGEDWFELSDGKTLTWQQVQHTVDTMQRQLADLIAGIESGKVASPIGDTERADLVLGITCHAIYHAGQIQLIKRLRGREPRA